MTPNQFYKQYSEANPKKLARVVEASGTNMANFKQIALHNGAVSRKLAKKLADASKGEMSILEILFPDQRVGKTG
jgi:hypothetical protein